MEEEFTLLDHAQFTAGAFLQGIQSLAQILDLGLQAAVAGLQLLDLRLLGLDLPSQGGDLRQTALPYPEAVLQPAQQQQQNEDQNAHGGSSAVARGRQQVTWHRRHQSQRKAPRPA